MRRFQPTCFRRRSTRGSARGRSTPSRRKCSRECGKSSAATSSGRREADPLQPHETAARRGDPCAMVIFGASGDLTKRKLIPALYNLAQDHLLAEEFALIGCARSQMSSEQFRNQLNHEIAQFATTDVEPDLWHWFSERIYYV